MDTELIKKQIRHMIFFLGTILIGSAFLIGLVFYQITNDEKLGVILVIIIFLSGIILMLKTL